METVSLVLTVSQTNPSFKYIQQAERKGFKPRLSEALGYEVETRLVLK